MSDKLQRPESFEFALDFLGDPEASELRAYIEQLEARAALAEPVGEGPTDEELLELAQHHSVSYTLSDGSVVYPLQEGCDMRDDVLSFARAVLARYGHQPASPAAGEVAELVEWLRANALTVQKASGNPANGAKQRMNRAADLLSQRHPAPVPVAEDDFLSEPTLRWWFEPHPDVSGLGWWQLASLKGSPFCYTHSLPATALPLPQGEVE